MQHGTFARAQVFQVGLGVLGLLAALLVSFAETLGSVQVTQRDERLVLVAAHLQFLYKGTL